MLRPWVLPDQLHVWHINGTVSCGHASVLSPTEGEIQIPGPADTCNEWWNISSELTLDFRVPSLVGLLSTDPVYTGWSSVSFNGLLLHKNIVRDIYEIEERGKNVATPIETKCRH